LRTIIRKGVKEGITPVVVASRAESVRRCSGCGTPIPCDQGCENASLCRHKQTTPCPVCHAVVGVRVSGWDPTRLAALLGTSVKTVNSKQLSQIKNAGLVILFDIDASLSVPSWASETYAVHLVVAAARAAGSNGKVLLVTGDVRQRLIRDLVARSDVLASAKRGLATAKAGGLPPYGRIVTINVKHKTMPDTENWPGKVLGPSKQGPEEFQIVVRIPTNELGKLTPYIAQLRKRSKIKVVVQ